MKEQSLAEKIKTKIQEIAAYADQIPGVVIIHNLQDFSVAYMSNRGQKILGVDQKELIEMGTDYYNRFFNTAQEKENIPKMTGLLEKNNNEEIIALFQQVLSPGNHEWSWYCTSVKIFMWDDEGKPILTIAVAIPIDPRHHITSKVARLLEENNFLRNNYENFTGLTKREKQILRCLALGNTSNAIANELHISVATVETHRKNIKRKLNINSTFDLSMYARAFDLV